MKWTDEEKQILMNCITEDDLREEFPNYQISSLRRRQREFRIGGEKETNKTLREEEMEKSRKKLFQSKLETNNKGEAQIMLWGDLHYGAPTCKIELAQEMLDYCLKKHIYVIGMGDYIEMATRVSPGSSLYRQVKTPQDQMDFVTEMLRPLAKKGLLLGLHFGNHEERAFSLTGMNVVRTMARELSHERKGSSCRNLGYSAFHLIHVGKQNYDMYTTHGSSGSRTPETKLRAVRRYGEYIDVEIIAIGHVHDLLSTSFDHYRVNKSKRRVEFKKAFYIITGSYLGHEGSYAEQKAMIPGQLGSPKVRFLADKHDVFVSF